MDKDQYIKKLERRIHMQRAQLRWWQSFFERGDLRKKSGGWPASRVNDLLKRLGNPHRVSSGGTLTRRVKFKSPEKDG